MFKTTLKIGSEGQEVKELQKRLNKELNIKLVVDGFFGLNTQEAVQQYQSKNNIVLHGTPETTGYGQLGPITRDFLNGTVQIELLPKVESLKNQLVALMQIVGEPIIVTDTYRSIEAQNALYAQGRTKKGNIVTNAKGGDSFHNWRVAFDVAFFKKGKVSYEGNWERLGKIGEIIGLEWGGNWINFVDRPHFQSTSGYSLSDFKKGLIDINKFK